MVVFTTPFYKPGQRARHMTNMYKNSRLFTNMYKHMANMCKVDIYFGIGIGELICCNF